MFSKISFCVELETVPLMVIELSMRSFGFANPNFKFLSHPSMYLAVFVPVRG